MTNSMRKLSTPGEMGATLARYEYFGPADDAWAPWVSEELPGSGEPRWPRDYYLGLVPSGDGVKREIHVIYEFESVAASRGFSIGDLFGKRTAIFPESLGRGIMAYWSETPPGGECILKDLYSGTDITEVRKLLSGHKVGWKPPFVSWWVASGRPLL